MERRGTATQRRHYSELHLRLSKQQGRENGVVTGASQERLNRFWHAAYLRRFDPRLPLARELFDFDPPDFPPRDLAADLRLEFLDDLLRLDPVDLPLRELAEDLARLVLPLPLLLVRLELLRAPLELLLRLDFPPPDLRRPLDLVPPDLPRVELPPPLRFDPDADLREVDSFAKDLRPLDDFDPPELLLEPAPDDFEPTLDRAPIRRAATAPNTPPTTVPTGPATLPMTAPVAIPAASFEIGGI